MLDYWLMALGLMLVLEGMMPFMFPAAWRETLRRVAQFENGQLRFLGLALMCAGLLTIYLVK